MRPEKRLRFGPAIAAAAKAPALTNLFARFPFRFCRSILIVTLAGSESV